MKKQLLSLLLLLVAATTMRGQTLLKGDMNNDGVIDIADVTALVNVAVGHTQAEAINVYSFTNNTAVVGTWYKQDGTSFIFRQDGTTTYPGGSTYEYLYLLRWLQIYNGSGTLVKTMRFREVTPQYLLEESDNGTTTRYISSAYMVSSITLNKTSLSLNSGSTSQLTATVAPSTALEKGVAWSSSNTAVATVNSSGRVTAVAGGSCTITATAKDGSGVSATCTVNVDLHEYVDLGLPSGTLWATCNIGADNPEDYGLYFAWGETTGYTQDTSDGRSFDWASYKWCNGYQNTLTKYCNKSSYGYNGFTDTLTELEPEDDAATANWGANWRMPSLTQFQELINSSYTTTTWTTQNGVKGRKITSKSNGNSLFLPAAGLCGATSLYDAGSSGYYWSRTLNTDNPDYGWYLFFLSSSIITNNYNRYNGRSVRPVRASQN